MNNIYKGALGESLAERYLIDNGYIIKDKNRVFSGCELDIIASLPVSVQKKQLKKEFKAGKIVDRKTLKAEIYNLVEKLVFVEVKYSSSKEYGEPFDRVGYFKQRQIIRAAQGYIDRYKLYNASVRFDVISIIDDKIEHLTDCFSL